ncbi:MAG: HPr family phosphocarrier protein [Lachnospiraceae bacterium]
MIREIMLNTSNDLRDFMHLACSSPMDIGVHTMDNQIADGKSVLGLMAIDYKKPVRVISEDAKFMKQLDRWAVDEAK